MFQKADVSRAAMALGITLCMAMGHAPQAAAQSLFSPARQVNDRVISNYDIEQRIRFMEALSPSGGDMRAEVLELLTEEAVQRDYARRNNLRVDADEINAGIAEFAARAEMSGDEFVAALAEVGVDRQTIANFVEAGLIWRMAVGRSLPPLVPVTGADAERVRDTVAILGRQRVLMSEIFLPTDPQFADVVVQIMELIEAAGSIDEFSALAREFSLAGTRDQGGRLPDWIALDNLPAPIASQIGTGRSGQIIGPLELGEAIAYFQIRAIDSQREIPADRVQVTYKRLLLPGGRSAENMARVAEMQARVSTCPELAPFARGLPEQALVEREALMREIPQVDAVELGRMNRGAISANVTEGGNLVVLMLCGRELQRDDRPSSDQLQNIIFDRRLGAMADLKLQQLIADAHIVDF